MKRSLLSLLLTMVSFFACIPAACANSWGLKGKLLEAVSAVDTWNDYTSCSDQAGNAAVMSGRYHNTLMLAEDGELHTYPTAVYQPNAKRDRELILNGSEVDFVLNYGDEEWYSFYQAGDGWYLTGARNGNALLTETERGYRMTDSDGSAMLPYRISLRDFNIKLFPLTAEAVRHLNRMHAALASGDSILGWWDDGEEIGRKYSGIGKGTTPVYSAPYGQSAWRAANGKAAVGLSGDLWVLRYMTNADGERYACIRYEVSERTQRIGYIPAELLGEAASGEPSEDWIHVPVYAVNQTDLTDDPLCSQYPQLSIPAGTQLDCLGLFGRDYAYVAAEVKDGAIVDGGAIVWGFVPLRDLALDADTHASIRWDVMEKLEGSWIFDAGGNQAEDILILHADGTYTGQYLSADDEPYADTHGSWMVTEYNPFRNLYWNDPPYEITLVSADGLVNVKGLSINDENGFSLTNVEGGGGYRRMEDSLQP